MLAAWISLGLAQPAMAQGIFSAEELGADQKIGSFYYFRKIDDFDDAERSFIAAFDADSEDGAGAIQWRCFSDGLNVVLSYGHYYGGDADDDIQVRYRFDDRTASGRQYWRMLQGNKSAYIRMGRVGEFTEQALASSRLVIEAIDPLDGQTLRYRFDLTSLSQALPKLGCKV